MMKKYLIAFVILLIPSFSSATGIQQSVISSTATALTEFSNEKVHEFFSNLVPGEGITETSIQLRENQDPDFSILGTRGLKDINDGKIFTQFSLFTTKQNEDQRIIGNLGFGSRKLFENNTIMAGINNFYDLDFEEEHLRTSLGIELSSAVFNFHANRYIGLNNGWSDEKVLDGWDLEAASQIPYLHWAKFFANSYMWEGEDRSDTEGWKYGSEMDISSNLVLTLAYDDKDSAGLDDEKYLHLNFVYPGHSRPNAVDDGISNVAWKENRDMSKELLKKVKRQNKIMIEFKGSSAITRSD